MHVIIATDGSKQSLQAARYLRSFADPATITSVSALAVVSPLAAVPFAGEDKKATTFAETSFRAAAEQAATDIVTALEGWGPKVAAQVRSGSPSSEIVKAAKAKGAGLIVLASQSSRTEAVLLGSVAHRVMNHAPCPVLVVRPQPKSRKSGASRAPR